jgi:hypothetical protein
MVHSFPIESSTNNYLPLNSARIDLRQAMTAADLPGAMTVDA